MAHPTQILIVLDAESLPSIDEITANIPHEREDRVLLRYSETGAPPITRHGESATPVDWDGLAQGIATLTAGARAAIAAAKSPAQIFVTGRAPLPAFIQLGYELSAWSEPLTFVNKRKDGTWDTMPVQSLKPSVNRFFDGRSGVPLSDASQATGVVVVFASTIGMPEAPRAALRKMVQDAGDDIAGIVELRTSESTILDAESVATSAQELAEAISQIPGSYPHATGLALAAGGPASLAFLLGRAVNRNIHGNVVVAEYEAPLYRSVLELPWRRRAPVVSSAPEDISARTATYERVTAALDRLRTSLAPEDFVGVLRSDAAATVIDRMQSLSFGEVQETDAFELSIPQRRVTLGVGLLDVLRRLPDDDQIRIAQLLLVHEVHHFDQSIQSTDYMEIGRAGVSLEEVDFWADVFSISVLARWFQRTLALETVTFRDVLLPFVDALILGISAFDRAEHGERVASLAERRLRRYLIWHLQRARAATVNSAADMDVMFSARLVAELAPLRGSLDPRWDKVVDRALPTTEFVAVFAGVLERFHSQPGFDPSTLVEAVRTYNTTALRTAMEFVLGKWLHALAPWAAQRVH